MPHINPTESAPSSGSGTVDLQITPDCFKTETEARQVRYSETVLEDAAAQSGDNVKVVELKGGAVGQSSENRSVFEADLLRRTAPPCGRSREEVIKEVSVSSVAFIGPSCRPQPAIESELAEFYKELDQIEHQDAAEGQEGGASQTCTPPLSTSYGKETKGRTHRNAFRPYPPTGHLTGDQRDYGMFSGWTAPPHGAPCNNVYRFQNPWQPPPPWPPYFPQSFRFQSPPPFPRNPMPPVHFESQVTHSDVVENKSWCSWEGRHFSSGVHRRAEQPNCEHALLLILMRGLPGSGKSTLAKTLMSGGPSGIILSTDDYFDQRRGFSFDPSLLGDAHDWNQERARAAMSEGRSPIIIDNTNVKAWEMKPYVALALEKGYQVEFTEPDTRWKCDPTELAKRNTHGVPRETISKMLERFDFPVSVDIVMSSCKPEHKNRAHHVRPHR